MGDQKITHLGGCRKDMTAAEGDLSNRGSLGTRSAARALLGARFVPLVIGNAC